MTVNSKKVNNRYGTDPLTGELSHMGQSGHRWMHLSVDYSVLVPNDGIIFLV